MTALSNAVNETLRCNETGLCDQSTLAETTEWRTLMAVYLSAILIISVAFNGTLCLMFYKKAHLLSVSNCFVLNLVCCQLCISILILPFCLAAVTTQNIIATGACCDVQGFCFTVIIVANQLALLAISVDRNYAIMNPLQYPNVITHRLCIILICASWTVALLLGVLPLIRSNMGRYKFHPNQFLCTLDWTSTSEYLFLFCTISFGVPILIQSYCYIQIFKAALGHSTRGKKIYPTMYNAGSRPPSHMETSTSSENADSDAYLHGFIECKAVRTIFVIAVAYSVCWVPYLVESFLSMSNIGVSPKFSAAAICFVFSTSIFNPMIYAFMNRGTRREIGSFVCGQLYLQSLDEPLAIGVSAYLPTWLSQYRTRSTHFSVVHNDSGTILEENEQSIYRDTIPDHVTRLEADTSVDMNKNMTNPLRSLNVKNFLLPDKLIFYSEIDRVFKHSEIVICNDKESCMVDLHNVPDLVMDTQQD